MGRLYSEQKGNGRLSLSVSAIAAAQKLTVSNWFVGMNKPLEIVV